MSQIDLSQLDIFYGDLTANRALVYARLPRPDDGADWKLTGQIRGPRCRTAQTLPATSPLVDLGPGPTLLARALVPEPCFWSPDLPAIYDLTVHLQRGMQVVATEQRQIGLRSLGVRGRHLILEGKSLVLRGVATESATSSQPGDWHEAIAAYVCNDFDLRPLEEASQCGALGVVMVRQRGENAISVLRKLSHYPAAAIAVLDNSLPDGFKKSAVAPNLLLAELRQAGDIARPSPWADVLVVTVEDPNSIKSANFRDKPVIAMRRLGAPLDIPAARAACDMLQRDLAPIGLFAGYIV